MGMMKEFSWMLSISVITVLVTTITNNPFIFITGLVFAITLPTWIDMEENHA